MPQLHRFAAMLLCLCSFTYNLILNLKINVRCFSSDRTNAFTLKDMKVNSMSSEEISYKNLRFRKYTKKSVTDDPFILSYFEVQLKWKGLFAGDIVQEMFNPKLFLQAFFDFSIRIDFLFYCVGATLMAHLLHSARLFTRVRSPSELATSGIGQIELVAAAIPIL